MAQRTAELRLDEAQWARILAQSGAPPPKAPMPQDGKSAQQQQALYLLVLEGDAPDANWKWWESALDAVVQTMQPTPAMTHSELLIPPEHEADDMHFAVYLGKNANWGRAFAGGAKFYLDPNGNAKSWRAIPIMGQDAVERVRRECDKHRETPYGSAYRLFNYPFSVPPLRSFAWMLDDAPGAPAHCASLVARCLRRSMPELNLTNASAWYGPSTLFLELTRKARMASYSRILEEEETVQSIAETEDAARAAAPRPAAGRVSRGSAERSFCRSATNNTGNETNGSCTPYAMSEVQPTGSPGIDPARGGTRVDCEQ